MELRNVVSVELTLTGSGGKDIETAPRGVRVGSVQLHDWQVDPVGLAQPVDERVDCYLVKVNFDLDLAQRMLPMNWFEIGLAFPSQDGEAANGQVTVVDALPHSERGPRGAASYLLTPNLQFMASPASPASQAYVSASNDGVDTYGVGSDHVRWRHVAPCGARGVRSGSYAAWIALAVPKGRAAQDVVVSVRFDLEPDTVLDYELGSTVATFTLPLPPMKGSRTLTVPVPPLSEGPAKVNDSTAHVPGPVVFVSYAHDNLGHKDLVRRFATVLMGCGVEVILDQWVPGNRQDWHHWALKKIPNVDFVIVIASAMCKAVGNGTMEPGRHRGMRSETAIIRELLVKDPDTWLRKVLPVVLPGETVENLPMYLQPCNADRYVVKELSEIGIDDLLRAMADVPQHEMPPLGPLATRLAQGRRPDES
ncbi:SEFIR domain-containing protein [Streptomyces sp. 796.1]|uniref:SEFIR domain-containing protein n=1 Tax=Streptomyces sp. 796.1 TaxID=3163029 RepID=UPI0039C8F01F